MLEDSWVWSKPPEGSSLEGTGPPLTLCPSEHAWHFQDREVGASERHRPKPGISSLLTTRVGPSPCVSITTTDPKLWNLSVLREQFPPQPTSGGLEGLDLPEGLFPSLPVLTLHP